MRTIRLSKSVWLRTVASALLAGLVLGAGVTTASAGSVPGDWRTYTIAGHEYLNIARVTTSTNSAYARTDTQWNGGGQPAGWAGSRGRLFTGSGSLSCEGLNTYNSAANTPAYGYSCTRLTSGVWYSYGVSYGWNGSGYTTFVTYRSPNQNS